MGRWSTSSFGSESARAKGSRILTAEFYRRHTLTVARDLLGKILVVTTAEGFTGGRIVETEAYRGTDPASHSARGKTPRCSVMFGDAGVAYVYFIYGMYEMLNFVTEPAGKPGAVLIRALEPLFGHELMRRRREAARSDRDLTGGPGRLCRAMGIQMGHNGGSLMGPVFQVLDDGYRVASAQCSPRVGISSGQQRYWRFFIGGNPCVSRAPQNAQARPTRAYGRLEIE